MHPLPLPPHVSTTTPYSHCTMYIQPPHTTTTCNHHHAHHTCTATIPCTLKHLCLCVCVCLCLCVYVHVCAPCTNHFLYCECTPCCYKENYSAKKETQSSRGSVTWCVRGSGYRYQSLQSYGKPWGSISNAISGCYLGHWPSLKVRHNTSVSTYIIYVWNSLARELPESAVMQPNLKQLYVHICTYDNCGLWTCEWILMYCECVTSAAVSTKTPGCVHT